ncbi:phospholipid scramblase-related protein [Nocardioides dilutus]
MTESANGAEGWRPDPFGRHETRFHDGRRWTPYVKDGEAHSLDEPVEGIDDDGPTGPEILTAPVLVVEQHVSPQVRIEPYSVFGGDGRDLGTVRRAPGADGRVEVLGGDGRLALTLTKASSTRKTVISVHAGNGAEMGRLMEQHLPGMTTYALESAAGGNVGYVRARTWVGWDIRVEDEHSHPVARISKHWDGLDRAAYPTADSYVVRVDREMRDPQRALVYAAALAVDSLLKKDGRGFQ